MKMLVSYVIQVVLILVFCHICLSLTGEAEHFEQINMIMKDLIEVVNRNEVHLPDTEITFDNLEGYDGKLSCFGSVIDSIDDIFYVKHDINQGNFTYVLQIPEIKLISKFSLSLNDGLKPGTVTGTVKLDLYDVKISVSSTFVKVKDDCKVDRPETKVSLVENKFSFKLENLHYNKWLNVNNTIDYIILGINSIISDRMSNGNSALFNNLEDSIGQSLGNVLEQDTWKDSLSFYSLCEEDVANNSDSTFEQYVEYTVINNEKINWYEAFVSCLRMGKTLASFRSKDEYDSLVALMPPTRGNPGYWISGRNTMDFQRFNFVWFTIGQPLDFATWDNGEPNKLAQGENCVELRSDRNFRMNNIECIKQRFYICEEIRSKRV